MGDPNGPWQQRGDGDHDDHAPRHLPLTPPGGGYDLGYGAQTAAAPGGAPHVVPSTDPGGPRPPRAAHLTTQAADADTGRIAVVTGPPAPGPSVTGPGVGAGFPDPMPIGPARLRPSGPDGPGSGHGHGHGHDDGGDGVPYGSRPGGYGPSGYDDDGYDDDERRGGAVASVQALAAEAAWRYRSAPLWARITADIAAASLVLVLIVGLSLALRQEGGAQHATADSGTRSTTTVSTTTTTVAPTTTTVATTTTTVATTTTTTAPTTTTTAAPVVPPPTAAPTTTLPPTTTTEAVSYRTCRSAMSAGALPLMAGDPGYDERLDSDRDGEACDDFDDWGGGRG
jgi:hypothetical protein